jgi:Tfp pilus assembly protein PilP
MGLWCYGRKVTGWALLCMLSSLPLLAQEEGENPILSIDEGSIAEGEGSSYVYDPANKRDPFLPTLGIVPPKQLCAEEPQTPLQSYELGQLKLVGIIWNEEEPRALVEDGVGTGYIVIYGTLVGSGCGKVKTIERGQVVIEEDYYDFYGDRQTREVVMELAASPEEGEEQ